MGLRAPGQTLARRWPVGPGGLLHRPYRRPRDDQAVVGLRSFLIKYSRLPVSVSAFSTGLSAGSCPDFRPRSSFLQGLRGVGSPVSTRSGSMPATDILRDGFARRNRKRGARDIARPSAAVGPPLPCAATTPPPTPDRGCSHPVADPPHPPATTPPPPPGPSIVGRRTPHPLCTRSAPSGTARRPTSPGPRPWSPPHPHRGPGYREGRGPDLPDLPALLPWGEAGVPAGAPHGFFSWRSASARPRASVESDHEYQKRGSTASTVEIIGA